MRSMTGYGRAVVEVARGRSSIRLVVEARSVNHRGFDLKIRSDEPDMRCEMEIARAVRTFVERGAVTVHVLVERSPSPALDVGRIRETLAALERIRREAGLRDPVDLGTVAAFLNEPGAGTPRVLPDPDDAAWHDLEPAVDAALADLVAMRRREGRALRAELVSRTDRLRGLVDQLDAATRSTPARLARRLEDRLGALRGVPGFEPGRIAQEIALLAERLDVTEELVRLRTHIEQSRELLADGAPVAVAVAEAEAEGKAKATTKATAIGRKLDFVIQEIARELNTVGSKAQDAGVAALVIDGKAELEKMREQAQNIE